MKLKEIFKNLAEENNMRLKEVIIKAGLNYDNILHKFQRDTLYYTDVEKILDVLGKRITFTDKTQQDKTHNNK